MCGGPKPKDPPKIPPPKPAPPPPPPPEPTPEAPEIGDRRKGQEQTARSRGKRSLRIDIGGVSGGSGVNVPGS